MSGAPSEYTDRDHASAPVEELAFWYLAHLRTVRAIAWEHRRELQPEERAAVEILIGLGSAQAPPFLAQENIEAAKRAALREEQAP